jgi:hypothetical protein
MLHGNPLSGSIPSELAKLSKLTSLTLHGNPMLNGSLPAGLYNLLRLYPSLNLTADCAAGAAAFCYPSSSNASGTASRHASAAAAAAALPEGIAL